jgi:tetratricopeptide (TPR) repeat protein
MMEQLMSEHGVSLTQAAQASGLRLLSRVLFLSLGLYFIGPIHSSTLTAQLAPENAAPDQPIQWNILRKQLVQWLRPFYQGHYADATRLAEEALQASETAFGLNHSSTAHLVHVLATLCMLQRRDAQAESFYKRIVSIEENAFGLDDPHVANALDNLVNLYWTQGRYAEAELLAQRALDIRRKAVGPEDLGVASSLEQVAGLYESQGRFTEAEPLYWQALTIRGKRSDLVIAANMSVGMNESQADEVTTEVLSQSPELVADDHVLVPHNPVLATALVNLAGCYWAQARDVEAEPLYQQALAILETTLKSGDLDLPIAGWQDSFVYAVRSLKRAREILETKLGHDHAHVAQLDVELAQLYSMQQLYAESKPLYQQALAIYEKHLGQDHPAILALLQKLASLCWTTESFSEGESYYRRILVIQGQTPGAAEPTVAATLMNLASLYWREGRYADVEALYRQTREIWERTDGSNTLRVAGSLENLANLYESQGRLSEAEPLYQQALAIYEKSYGLDHPDLAIALVRLARLYRAQGRDAEAEPLYQRALTVRGKIPEHGDLYIAEIMDELADVYVVQGKHAEAESLYQRVLASWLDMCEKSLGRKDSCDTLELIGSLEKYTTLLRTSGRVEEAQAIRASVANMLPHQGRD